MKVVINNCFGGFSLSPAGVLKYAELSGFKVFAYTDDRTTDFETRKFIKVTDFSDKDRFFILYWLKNDLGDVTDSETLNGAEWLHDRDIKRNDVNLVKTVQLLKKKANGSCAELKIIEVPDDAEWHIHEYDGNEHVAENHRTWP